MSTTTDEQTTVTIEGEGFSTGPIPMDEFNEAADAAAARLREPRQLGFEVGGCEPNCSSIKASINLSIGQKQLRKGDQVRIAVTSADGEVLAQTLGKIVSVGFEDLFEKGFLVGCERVHKVTVGG